MISRAVGKRVQTLAATSLRHYSETSSVMPVPSFSEVKFVKEDVETVMQELPDYSFYEMNDSVENPYKGRTLDTSIVLSPQEAKLEVPKVEFSKLENGMKIASVDRQGLTASLGLFVGAGSRFEDSSNFGVSHMVELMAYKSTAHLSHLRTVKTLEQLGGQHSSICTAGREDIVYQVDVMREYVPLVVPLMVGNVLFPRLLPWEVKAASAKVQTARDELAGNPDAMISELLHKAAYCNNTLGNSVLASKRSLPYFTPETMRSFMLDHFAPERMVLVGVNVAHAELSKWAMRSFADYNAIPMKPRPETKAAYTGGDLRAESASPYCHFAIGLESAPWGQADLAPITLLQTILGGGSASGSAAVSGSSLSRLSTEVLQQSPYVESCSAFNTSYSDSGLFGAYTVVAPEKAGEAAQAVAATMSGLTSVSSDEVSIAKKILIGNIHRQSDDASSFMKDMGTQLLLSGRYGSAADFARAIDGVTADEVAAAARKLLSSKPAVAACGDTHTMPSYAAVEASLK